mgnify:CR=1 FL=1
MLVAQSTKILIITSLQGSVLVNDAGVIIARGHNMRVQTGDPTAHAEMVAIK